MAAKRRILFITGTRADFGKLKPLMRAVEASPDMECHIFVTGMHLLARYGYTYRQVEREGFTNVFTAMNQMGGEAMDLVLANTVQALGKHVAEDAPDMIVVHGDRLETLAGAIVGAFRNILVAHVEGGERSGTIDEMIRHSVTKLAHLHFVANDEARGRLLQMGEHPDTVFVIGSPDIDIMLSPDLPSLDAVRERYDIAFPQYAVALYHPVTTEPATQAERAQAFASALLDSGREFVVISPNNDAGSEHIHKAYETLKDNARFRLFPSMRFEFFLRLMQNARFIIGNSSAGIREAPIYGVRTINVGSRQKGRFLHDSIHNVPETHAAMLGAIQQCWDMESCSPCYHFGQGNSVELFMRHLGEQQVWSLSKQKHFQDICGTKLG
ncbi:MAG TPA: UDP-N-acetylglucosamine 2-epimerase [Humidesulfovibrio sp.]|uniref:UDP-N-acetylglucosamine 2-epimerase n=1 Tax=Humidesulfovibrio sp. TaxID=2910988 RepID=UPI002C155C59|nr:UDP-N-acetylglucosamine 2-epimerase [Humidesulfovibrio sp.]HWR02989.1 UDP-N-acetylglucosamine 2-epimerase [Humidesulfovibrio sp.]